MIRSSSCAPRLLPDWRPSNAGAHRVCGGRRRSCHGGLIACGTVHGVASTCLTPARPAPRASDGDSRAARPPRACTGAARRPRRLRRHQRRAPAPATASAPARPTPADADAARVTPATRGLRVTGTTPVWSPSCQRRSRLSERGPGCRPSTACPPSPGRRRRPAGLAIPRGPEPIAIPDGQGSRRGGGQRGPRQTGRDVGIFGLFALMGGVLLVGIGGLVFAWLDRNRLASHW